VAAGTSIAPIESVSTRIAMGAPEMMSKNKTASPKGLAVNA